MALHLYGVANIFSDLAVFLPVADFQAIMGAPGNGFNKPHDDPAVGDQHIGFL